jgi:hypothetical protein
MPGGDGRRPDPQMQRDVSASEADGWADHHRDARARWRAERTDGPDPSGRSFDADFGEADGRSFVPPDFGPPSLAQRGVVDEDNEVTSPLPVYLPGTGMRPNGAMPAGGVPPPAAPRRAGSLPPVGALPPPPPHPNGPVLPGASALPGATTLPRPEPVAAPRGPFEAARPGRSVSASGSVEPPPAEPAEDDAGASRPISQAASAKLEQIKDLYLTAEAIGEDALDKHFDQVSQRQRELIREFFERSEPAQDS